MYKGHSDCRLERELELVKAKGLEANSVFAIDWGEVMGMTVYNGAGGPGDSGKVSLVLARGGT